MNSVWQSMPCKREEADKSQIQKMYMKQVHKTERKNKVSIL